MTEFNIPWNKSVGFSVDKTSVNLGAHNSILSHELDKIYHATSWAAHVKTLLIKEQ